jgi:hypothetical protein
MSWGLFAKKTVKWREVHKVSDVIVGTCRSLSQFSVVSSSAKSGVSIGEEVHRTSLLLLGNKWIPVIKARIKPICEQTRGN